MTKACTGAASRCSCYRSNSDSPPGDADVRHQVSITVRGKVRKRKILHVLLAGLLLFTCISNAAVVCRLPALHGFEQVNEIGKKLVGDSTTDLSQMKVFMTYAHGNFYAHSNFIVTGFSHPTKLVLDEYIDLETIVWNLVCAEPACVSKEEIEHAIQNDIEFLVDSLSLGATPFGKLDFSKVKKAVWNPKLPEITKATAATKVSFDFEKELKKVGNSPVNRSPAEKTPSSLSEAFVAMLWDSLLGKAILVVAILLAGGFAFWVSLPNEIKTRVLYRYLGSH